MPVFRVLGATVESLGSGIGALVGSKIERVRSSQATVGGPEARVPVLPPDRLRMRGPISLAVGNPMLLLCSLAASYRDLAPNYRRMCSCETAGLTSPRINTKKTPGAPAVGFRLP